MDRIQLVQRLRTHGREFVHEFLPVDANTELAALVDGRRQEVDADAYRIFMSIRALLQQHGMPGCESDCEAGKVMALFNRNPA